MDRAKVFKYFSKIIFIHLIFVVCADDFKAEFLWFYIGIPIILFLNFWIKMAFPANIKAQKQEQDESGG